MQGLQWPRIRFWRKCKACNGSESDSGGIVRSAMAQNQILGKMQGVQWPKIGFYEDCRACNGPKPGFTGIAGHAMAPNRVLRGLQGVQWPKNKERGPGPYPAPPLHTSVCNEGSPLRGKASTVLFEFRQRFGDATHGLGDGLVGGGVGEADAVRSAEGMTADGGHVGSL